MVILSTLLVPLVYRVCRSLFNARAAIGVAALVALSPSLSEHASQIRPYGLLAILVVLACYHLVRAIDDDGWRHWMRFALAGTLMLYTHNWTWLVFGGALLAAFIAIVRSAPTRRRRLFAQLGLSAAVILFLFLPWMSSLIFQAGHAGHTGLGLMTISDRLGFLLFAIVSIPDYLLLGTYPRDAMRLVLIACGVAAAAVPGIVLSKRTPGSLTSPRESGNAAGPRAIQVMLITSGCAVAGAAVLSPWSTLFIERCVAIVTPLVLIAVAALLDRMVAKSAGIPRASLGIGLFVFLLALEAANDVALAPTARSNARAVAAEIRASMRDDDLLIVAPEWFAPSFNHYFPPSIEQKDHPFDGRSGPVDFSSERRRTLDPAATQRLENAISAARANGRRVWLVSERKYLRYADDVLPKLSSQAERERYAPVMRAKEARDLLSHAYGQPDTSHFVHGRVSRYEELLPFLFAPPLPASTAF